MARRLRLAKRQLLQLDPGNRKAGIAEMKKAKLEAPLVFAFEAVFRRHREIERGGAAAQLGSGEVAPRQLKPAEHDDVDAEHRQRRAPRRLGAAAQAEAVTSRRQEEMRAVKDAAGRLAAPHGDGAV